jgi:N-acetyl-gamma-glutamyl-phosphate reductase
MAAPGPVRVGVVGASGYSGTVAARLITGHPAMALVFATSDAKRGASLSHLGIRAEGTFIANTQAEELARDCDAVILATPAEVSHALAPKLRKNADLTICDLSGAFRLRSSAEYKQFYGFAHEQPGLLDAAFYGLPELFGAPQRGALVASPGCYPTATLLALAPVTRFVQDGAWHVDAKSGTTGAGRQAKEEHAFAEVAENLRAYRVHKHQHEPEIFLHLARKSGASVDVVFVPHLLPVRRGILVTAYARLKQGVSEADVRGAYEAAYAKSRFVQTAPPEEVTLASVVGTNDARIGWSVRDRSLVVFAAIDNLLKGAAGQGIQSLNLAFGLAEDAGLDRLLRTAAS